MLNYLRYFIVALLLGLLFYTHTMSIEPAKVQASIDKKLPKKIDKKGFLLTLNRIDIIDTTHNIITAHIDAKVKISTRNKFKKLLPKRSVHFTVETRAIPKIHGTSLSFELLSFKMNKLIKLKKVKGILKKKIEKIRFPIKKLKKFAWFLSVKKVLFLDNGVLLLSVGLSKLMIFLLIPLFLLREIGLVLIILYQKFLSPRKKYRCAKGELYQEGTCSSTTKEVFQKQGFIAGIKAYRRSTKHCKEAYKILKKEKKPDGTSCDAFSFCPGCSGGSCGADSAASSASVCDLGAGCDVVPCDVGSC